MKTARDWAHESEKLSWPCGNGVHAIACDEATAAIRSAQIEALKWALNEVGEVRVPVTLYLTTKAKIAELERETK